MVHKHWVWCIGKVGNAQIHETFTGIYTMLIYQMVKINLHLTACCHLCLVLMDMLPMKHTQKICVFLFLWWRIEKLPLLKESSQQDSKWTNETLWILWDHVSLMSVILRLWDTLWERGQPQIRPLLRTMKTFSSGQLDGCWNPSFPEEVGNSSFLEIRTNYFLFSHQRVSLKIQS